MTRFLKLFCILLVLTFVGSLNTSCSLDLTPKSVSGPQGDNGGGPDNPADLPPTPSQMPTAEACKGSLHNATFLVLEDVELDGVDLYWESGDHLVAYDFDGNCAGWGEFLISSPFAFPITGEYIHDVSGELLNSGMKNGEEIYIRLFDVSEQRLSKPIAVELSVCSGDRLESLCKTEILYEHDVVFKAQKLTMPQEPF